MPNKLPSTDKPVAVPKVPKKWSLADKIAATSAVISAVLSVLALGISWNTATKQTYRDRIDARISNCAAVASVYASQSWAYGISDEEPDQDLETYSHKAMAIGRAAQLCRNQHGSVSELRHCIAQLVDAPSTHKVIETGADGKDYDNLVC